VTFLGSCGVNTRTVTKLILCGLMATQGTALNASAEEDIAASSFAEVFSKGKIKGLLRYSAQYRDSNLHILQDSSTPDISDEKIQQYSALGGYLGFETAPLFHTSVGATYENRSVEGLQLNFAYLNKQKERNAEEFVGMVRAARVTSGCGELDGTGNCVTSGSKILLRGNFDPTDYNEQGNYAGDRKNMPMFGLVYSPGGYSVELWDYYVEDFVNMIYVYGDYTIAPANSDYSYSFAAQYANQAEVGDHVAGDIDTWFYGFKFMLNGPGLSFFTAYNEVEYNESSYDGGTIFVRWGTPQMFNSFQVQDSELAGTKSIGTGFQYDFGRQGILPGVVMRVRFAQYDLPDSLSQADARQDRSEATFDLRYSFTRDSASAYSPRWTV